MRRMFAGAVVGLVTTGALIAPGQAAADPEETGCQIDQALVQHGTQQLMQGFAPTPETPRTAAKLESVDPSRFADIMVSLRPRGCWSEPAVLPVAGYADEPWLAQHRLDLNGSVDVSVDRSRAHRDLADVLDYDRATAQSAAGERTAAGNRSETAVLDDIMEDYQSFPSWLLRTRTTIMRSDGSPDSTTETTQREIAVTTDANTYLVIVRGFATEESTAERDVGPAITDDVAEHVREDLDIEATR